MSADSARESADIRIVLEREFNAPPRRVWQAWTQAEVLSGWFCPPGVDVTAAAIDARPGGSYDIAMRAADGATHRVAGRYTEVIPETRLAFTWAWTSTPERESHVTVELEATATGTRLTLTHARFADDHAAASHRDGWRGSFDKLAAHLG